MKIRDLMHTSVLSVAPGDLLSQAAQRMAWARVRHLPVVDQYRVVGLLTEGDVVANCSDLHLSQPVSSLMRTAVALASPEDDPLSLVERMRVERVDGFPVVEGGRLVGFVTGTDLLAHLVGARAGVPEAAAEAVVHDLMTPEPETARLDDLFLDAIGRMTHRGVRHLPIVDGDRKVVGILSDRDVRSVAGEFLSMDEKDREVALRMEYLRVADVVHASPLTVQETAPVSQLVRLLVGHRIGAVPVVDEQDRLVGIASYIDVLRSGLSPEPLAARRPRAEADHAPRP